MYHVVLIMCCKLQLFVTKGGIRYSYFFIGYIRDKDGVRMEVGFGVERTLFSPGPNGHNYRHLCFSAVQTGKNIYKQNELRITKCITLEAPWPSGM